MIRFLRLAYHALQRSRQAYVREVALRSEVFALEGRLYDTERRLIEDLEAEISGAAQRCKIPGHPDYNDGIERLSGALLLWLKTRKELER